MRSRDRALARGTRTPLPAFVVTLGAALVAGSSLEACRKPAPDEIVNTGQFKPPHLEPVPTAGTTAAGGSSGTEGVGARGGTAPNGGGGEGGDEPGVGGTAGSNATGGTGGTEPEPVCPPVVASTEAFTKRRLLEGSAACAKREYCLFQDAAAKLRDSTRAQADDPSDATAAAARDAWLAAIGAWEEAEIFLFGPAAAPANPGGQGLRDLIYSWPLVARCKVDEQTVSRFYANDAFFGSASASPTTGRTLHALEYLLFYQGTDNGCTAYSTINSTRSWAGIAPAELRRRKIDYAARAAEDVAWRADALVHAWSPDGDDFGRTLAEVRAPYTGEQAAANAVSNGLFYVEKELKDTKLALPLGIDPSCPATSCPSMVEAPFAGTSSQHIAANLRGFRKLFQGCGEDHAGIAFDDWLDAVGATDLRARMLAALDGAEAAFADVDVPLETLIATDPARARALYDAVKRLTDLLKTEFVTVLNLTRPGPTEGDND